MKERPILFSGAMVRALLDGSKTQTRRVVKPQPQVHKSGWLEGEWLAKPMGGLALPTLQDITMHCPHGVAGDRIWVRETWQGPIMSSEEWEAHGNDSPGEMPSKFNTPAYCEYAADGGPAPEFMDADDNLHQRWRPSIFMPRWASRISLEVVSVRVERLQAISEADARAEGAPGYDEGVDAPPNDPSDEWSYRASFERLWCRINGAESWAANPWVWVVEFRPCPHP